MKKIIALFILAICCISCSKEKELLPESHFHINRIVVFDGCEYIEGWGLGVYGGPIFTHKGNCKNNEHKINQPEVK